MPDAPASRNPVPFSPIRLGPSAARKGSSMIAHATLLVNDQVFTDEHVAGYAERARQVAVPGGGSGRA